MVTAAYVNINLAKNDSINLCSTKLNMPLIDHPYIINSGMCQLRYVVVISLGGKK